LSYTYLKKKYKNWRFLTKPNLIVFRNPAVSRRVSLTRNFLKGIFYSPNSTSKELDVILLKIIYNVVIQLKSLLKYNNDLTTYVNYS